MTIIGALVALVLAILAIISVSTSINLVAWGVAAIAAGIILDHFLASRRV